jgi:pyruvate/2-oxoglutarate dehydrogenase complex dihydrolipoamide dehydrogenase (E3) component
MNYDVIIIGSGQAGVPLATRLAAAGKSVLLAERGRLGGTCVNYGCTPTKTMMASAQLAHDARRAGALGVRTGDVSVDLAAVVDRKEAVVARWREGVDRRLREAGERLRVAHGHARLVGGRAVEVGGERHEAGAVVLNVGTRPAALDVPGIEGVPHLDNGSIMALRSVPAHLLVVGGGYIGCEFGQMFRRFGAEVTIVSRGGQLLPREDRDVAAALEGALRSEGVGLEFGARPEAAAGDGAGGVVLRLAGGRELRGSHLLAAVGRRPNTDDLGCDRAGVRLDGGGFVAVDDGYATSAPGIYAVGDATGGPQFTHASWDDHRLLFDRLLGRPARGRSQRLVPFTVFTDPQIAGVGLDEGQARARGIAYELATMPFDAVARAIEVDRPAGTMKLLVDRAGETILGARLVGAEAGELVHVFVALMQAGAGPRALVDAEFVHPTFAEGLQSLVMRLERFALR